MERQPSLDWTGHRQQEAAVWTDRTRREVNTQRSVGISRFANPSCDGDWDGMSHHSSVSCSGGATTCESSEDELGRLDIDLDRKSKQHNLTSRNVRAILHVSASHALTQTHTAPPVGVPHSSSSCPNCV